MLNPYGQAGQLIKKSHNILVTARSGANGDAMASALALYHFLKKEGKETDIVIPNNRAQKLSFLPAFLEIGNQLENLRQSVISLKLSDHEISQVKYQKEEGHLRFLISLQNGNLKQEDLMLEPDRYRYDLIIAVDTPELEMLNNIFEQHRDFFYKTPIINIDCHPGNEEFGQINLVNLTATSSAEIIFDFLKQEFPDHIDEDIATCILAGMIARTKSFKSSHITPLSLEKAGELISLGARREEIVNHLYRSKRLPTMKLWGRVLGRLKNELDGRMVWTFASRHDFLETGTDKNDLFGIVEEVILNMPAVHTALVLYEESGPSSFITHGLVYTTKNIDALSLIKEFSPQGSHHASEFQLPGSIDENQDKIINLITNKLAQTPT